MTPDLGSEPAPTFGILAHFSVLVQPLVQLSRHTTGVVNTMQPSQLVDNDDRWTLFAAFYCIVCVTVQFLWLE